MNAEIKYRSIIEPASLEIELITSNIIRRTDARDVKNTKRDVKIN